MFIGNFKQGDDVGAFQISRAAGIKMAAHGACDAINIHLAEALRQSNCYLLLLSSEPLSAWLR